MRAGPASVFLLALGCATAPAVPGTPSEPRAVLERFVAAAEAGRWAEAYPLLSPRWRALTTPARLGADLDAAGAAGRDALARVRAMLPGGGRWAVSDDTATLAVGEGRKARLVREGPAWRVDALE